MDCTASVAYQLTIRCDVRVLAALPFPAYRLYAAD